MNSRCANYVVWITATMDELQNLVDKVWMRANTAGYSQTQKGKGHGSANSYWYDRQFPHLCQWLTTWKCHRIHLPWSHFLYTWNDSEEIRRNQRVALGDIWRDRSVSIMTKKRLLHSLLFSFAIYCSDCTVLKAPDGKRLESFELWCYRRSLRVSWI